MAPSKQFVNVPTRQTRLYANVSEDRMELLLDRLRASIQKSVDWVGVFSAIFAVIASYISLYDSWKASTIQIVLLWNSRFYLALGWRWLVGSEALRSMATAALHRGHFATILPRRSGLMSKRRFPQCGQSTCSMICPS